MASPAFVVDAQETRDNRYFRVPNEFAENQHAFIPAERALALIIFREASIVKNGKRQTDINGTAKISDQYWHDCTGLEPRMLENAVRGLKAKGLEVTGRGTKAVYRWNWTRWTEAMRSRPNPAAYDPNRKERDARRAAQNVHPDCATGCAKIRECKASESSMNTGTPFLVTNIAQPVAQTVNEAWALTIAAVAVFFPLAAIKFILRLLQVVRGVFPKVTDHELATAIRRAYIPSQYSEVLFLRTVPNMIATMHRERKKASGSPAPGQNPEDLETAKKILRAVESGDEEKRSSSERWSEQDIEWARETLHLASSGSGGSGAS
jgi:hypothetical protein